ncbi:MAG: glucan biosynthesis protein [Pseudomonadota bacterium]|nr:glucan biosynthesis protein [Pseudomonadota bacterium]
MGSTAATRTRPPRSSTRLLRATCTLVVALQAAVGTQAAPSSPANGQPFDFSALQKRAESLAQNPYKAPETPVPEVLRRIDFDTHQSIQFVDRCTLWHKKRDRFPVQLFHMHQHAPHPVRLERLSNGAAEPVRYDPECFDFGDTGLADQLPEGLGYAGFRVLHPPPMTTDWLAYQGASYFRSAGPLDQYGLSARGIAVNTALPQGEEFPQFTRFWLEQPDATNRFVVYALLDGPSLAGAYRFVWQRPETGPISAEVDAVLFPRQAIDRLGIAPLTSMYWYGEGDRHRGDDWRPEVHDNDGLALHTGSGERIWRPLINPRQVRTSSFFDNNPRGFGLMQRDRAFVHYEDDGAFYERRPSLWIEPIGAWGEGAVQLVEIPTEGEIHDNIVAYWVSAGSAQPGQRLHYRYRMEWTGVPDIPDTIGRVVHTRTGRPGIPGTSVEQIPPGRRFVVDFAGGAFNDMPQRFDLVPQVSTSHGTVTNAYSLRVVGTKRWRAVFDLHYTGEEPVDLRLHLKDGDRHLTETWLYQYLPG